MADPFLLAHLVSPFFFDIEGTLSPISIRDQMIRGRMIVDRAVEEGLLNRGARSLLVIGAGAAGATAAIRAAQHGVHTMLIDIAPAPFLRQAGCRSRWVDPTQYDWPVDHWAASRYPWKPPRMPLPWRANYANDLAVLWTMILNTAHMQYRGLLDVRYSTTIIPPLRPVGMSLQAQL
jgi:hypothetical protein